MAYTNKLSVVAHAYKDIVDAVATALSIEDVFYGNQIKFPRTPSVVIEPDDMRADITHAPRTTTNIFLVEILIVHCKVQDNQITRAEADVLAEALQEAIEHKDNITLGGLVVHQFVRRMKSGYVNRPDSQYMSTLLTAEAQSQFMLPSQFS
jgi:hypothetical protein